MCEDMSNIDAMGIVVDSCDQSSLITANIENGEFAYSVSTWKRQPQFDKGIKLSMFHDPIP